jgi:hypothetical protein
MIDEAKPFLPSYEAKHSKDFPGFLIVWCPRKDCPGVKDGRPFLVYGRTWLRPNRLISIKTGMPFVISGRSCPYCFRAARLPKRSAILPD